MLHKTLESYHHNVPYEGDNQEHPDGPLWLLTAKELSELPVGMVVEHIDGSYKRVTPNMRKIRFNRAYTVYGIRGYKND